MCIELAIVTIAAISAIIAAYTAIQSKKAVEASLNGIASQFLHSQSEKYASDKMKKSIRLLIEHYKNHIGCDFVEKFLKDQKTNPELEEARRTVKFFFLENYNLLKLNVFNLKHLKILAYDINVCVLLHIIKPIEIEFVGGEENSKDIEMYFFYEKEFPNATKDKIGFDCQLLNN